MLYLLILINPLLSMVFYIYCINDKKNNISKEYLYLSLFLGIIGMGMPIIGNVDLLRHYYRYETVNINIPILDYLKLHKDFFIHLVYYYGRLFHIKKEFMTLLVVFLAYFYFFKSFYLVSKKSRDKIKNIMFILFFMNISFANLVYGLRTLLAVSLFLYGICQILILKRKKGFLFIFFANTVHFMSILYTCLFVLLRIYKNYPRVRKYIFYLSVVFAILPVNIIQNMIRCILLALPFESYQKLINVYVDGYWGIEYLKDRSLKGSIYIYLLAIKYVWLFIYTKKYCLKSNVSLAKKYLCLLVSLSFILFPLPKLRERYLDLPILFSIILYMCEKIKVKRYTYFLVIISCLYFFMEIFKTRLAILPIAIKLLYPTIYSIFFDNIDYMIQL